MITIDAHQHFWRTAAQEQPWRTAAHRVLERDYLPEDLLPELRTTQVDATVVMQSVDEQAENDRLAEYAKYPAVAGAVAWAPIRDPEAALAELDRISIPTLCGVRCLIADDPLDWLLDAQVLRMFETLADRGLAWDVVPITSTQTRQVIKLAHTVPQLQIVVDHLGRPPLDGGQWQPWADHIAQLAECPGVAMKVSVGIDALTAWQAWDTSVLEPYVKHAVEQFGAAKLMIGSNWPVVLLRASYATAWNATQQLLEACLDQADDLAEVLGGTAARVYGLPRPPARNSSV